VWIVWLFSKSESLLNHDNPHSPIRVLVYRLPTVPWSLYLQSYQEIVLFLQPAERRDNETSDFIKQRTIYAFFLNSLLCNFHSCTVHLDTIKAFIYQLMHNRVALKNIKIYIKTSPTYFGAITIVRELLK